MLCLEARVLIPNYDRILKLKKYQWQNDEFLELAIKNALNRAIAFQHRAVIRGDAENLHKAETELMDLFIMLFLWANDEPELLEQRLEGLLSHAEGQKGQKKN